MKKLLLVALLAIIGSVLAGCVDEVNSDTLYEIINIEDITDQNVIKWYEEHYRESGFHTLPVEGQSDYQYLLLSVGERPTGGYSLEIVSAVEQEDVIVFDVKLNAPGKDDIVTMALTYPHLLLIVRADNKTVIKINYDLPDEEHLGIGDLQSEILLFERISGVYVGAIDNNFVEIDISGDLAFKQFVNIPEDTMSFKLSENAKAKMESITENDNIVFDCYQDANNTWIIDNITSFGAGNIILSENGIYIGRVDPTFIEIMIHNESKTFKFPEAEEELNGFGELEDNTAVYLEYIKNNQGQLEISSIGEAPLPGTPEDCFSLTATAKYMWLGNNNRCELLINGETEYYWIAEEQREDFTANIAENDFLSFRYYIDDYGRKVILGYEKVEYELKTDSDRFIDVNVDIVNIKISGAPDELGAKSFKLSDVSKEQINQLNLKENDQIKFDYYMIEGELNTIVSIMRLAQ